MTDTSYQNAITRDHRKLTSLFEVIGSILAMVYAMSIAMNIGAEMLGFSLLLVSSALFAGWAILDRRWTFLLLQVLCNVSNYWVDPLGLNTIQRNRPYQQEGEKL